MHAMNMQLTEMVGADWTLYPWRHNSSNVGGVTAGHVGHNSSNNNNNRLFYSDHSWLSISGRFT